MYRGKNHEHNIEEQNFPHPFLASQESRFPSLKGLQSSNHMMCANDQE